MNGKKLASQLYLLRGPEGDTTYIKLRDLANALNGTKAQFSVDITEDGSISLVKGMAYKPVGLEDQAPFTGDQTYALSTRKVLIDGEAMDIPAFTLGNGGYTYYQLSELGAILGYEVGWSRETDITVTAAPMMNEGAKPKDVTTAEELLAALDDPDVSEVVIPKTITAPIDVQQDVTLNKPLTVYGGLTPKNNVCAVTFSAGLTNNSTLTVEGPSFVITFADFTNNGTLDVKGGRFACHDKVLAGTGDDFKAVNNGTVKIGAYFETRVPFTNKGTVSCIVNAFTFETFDNKGSVVVGTADKHPESTDDLVWLSLNGALNNSGKILLRGDGVLYFADPKDVSWENVEVVCQDESCAAAIADGKYPTYHMHAPEG